MADVTVGDLTDAIAAWAADEVPAPCVAGLAGRDVHEHPRPPSLPDLLVAYDFDARELRGVVCLDIEPDEDPALVEDNRLVIRTATQAA